VNFVSAPVERLEGSFSSATGYCLLSLQAQPAPFPKRIAKRGEKRAGNLAPPVRIAGKRIALRLTVPCPLSPWSVAFLLSLDLPAAALEPFRPTAKRRAMGRLIAAHGRQLLRQLGAW
jgi:hypothetical protein